MEVEQRPWQRLNVTAPLRITQVNRAPNYIIRRKSISNQGRINSRLVSFCLKGKVVRKELA